MGATSGLGAGLGSELAAAGASGVVEAAVGATRRSKSESRLSICVAS